MSSSSHRSLFALLAFVSVAGSAAAADPAPSLAQYRIKLTLEGVWGPYNTPDCPAKPGKETLEGTVRGDESAIARDGAVEYRGTLNRQTDISICDAHQTASGDDYCVTHLTGSSKVKLKLTINSDRPGAWIQWEPVAQGATATAEGGCEDELTNGNKDIYLTQGDLAEIPSVPAGRLVENTKYTETDGPRSKTTLEVLGRQGLRAIPGGPYPIERAATVTLDGSRSTPESGHTIQTYSWDLTPLGTPDGCAGVGAPKTVTGATVSFVGLCSVKAKLTVTQDDGAVDAQETEVTVSPRAWRTELTTDKKPRLQNFTFVANGFVFGYNRCARDGHFDEDKNHWYEPSAGSTTDYEEGTYWLDQVSDDGPFAGIFFVSKKDFDLKRGFWVNKRLTPNGDVYDLNTGAERSVANCSGNPAQCKFGKPVIERLEASVEAHEKLHSELALGAVAGARDPAIGIEKSLGSNRAALKQSVNLLVTTAVSDMTLASSEENVKARMRSGPFKDGGCIDFPAWDGAIKGCYFHFVTFADKGERDMAP